MATRKTTIIKPVSVSEQMNILRDDVKMMDKEFHSVVNNIDNQLGEIRKDHYKLTDDLITERNKKKRRQEMFWLYALVAVYVIFIAVYTVRTFQRR